MAIDELPDTIVEVKVDYEQPEAAAQQLFIGIRDTDQREIVKRKAVILRTGINRISLKFVVPAKGYAATAALFLSREVRHPWGEADFLGGGARVAPKDTITMDWTIDFIAPRHNPSLR